jgi:HEAT repeat protein
VFWPQPEVPLTGNPCDPVHPGPTVSTGRKAKFVRTRRAAERTAPDLSWSRWWELNRSVFFDVRELYHAGIAGTITGVPSGTRPHRPDAAFVAAEVHPLFFELLDAEPMVAATALVGLARTANDELRPQVVEPLRRFLRTARDDQQVQGMLALASLASPELAGLARDIAFDRTDGRRATGRTGSIPESLRSIAALALARCAPDAAAEDLIRLLEEERAAAPDLRSSTILALGTLLERPGSRTRIQSYLFERLHAAEWSPQVLAHVPLALARVPDPATVAVLVGLLEEREPRDEVRRSITIALGEIADPGDERVTDLLEEQALRDVDVPTRRFSIVGLARLLARDAVALREPASANLQDTAQFFFRALRSRHGKAEDLPWYALASALFARQHGAHAAELGDAIEDLVHDGSRDSRAAAVLALGILGQEDGREAVRWALDSSSDPLISGYAAEALGMLGHRPSRVRLFELATSAPSDFLRYHAALGLAFLAEPSMIVPLVRSFAATSDPRLQTALARALGELGDERALPELAALARNPEQSAWTRALALAAVARIVQDEPDWSLEVQRAYNATITPPSIERVLHLF